MTMDVAGFLGEVQRLHASGKATERSSATLNVAPVNLLQGLQLQPGNKGSPVAMTSFETGFVI